MEYSKFIVSGEDRKNLSIIKNALVSNGHIFIGYAKNPFDLLRHIRGCMPDLVVVEVGNFMEIKQVLQVIEDNLLAACILAVNVRTDDIMNFIRNSKLMFYVTKPVFNDVILQVADVSLMNFRRVLDYEKKIKDLNDTLEARRMIEKAKWILVEKDGITEAEAYEAMRKKSRDNRMPMKNVAEAIILARG